MRANVESQYKVNMKNPREIKSHLHEKSFFKAATSFFLRHHGSLDLSDEIAREVVKDALIHIGKEPEHIKNDHEYFKDLNRTKN